MMEEIVDVNTGEVKVSRGKVILRAIAIGSCIVVAAYDYNKKIGAMAHIMLPGAAGKKEPEKTKYAVDAIDAMIEKMAAAGSRDGCFEACLVGAANVLKRQDDTICQDNIKSATELLKQKQIPIRASVLGGTARKGVFLSVESGSVCYTEGNEKEKLLWKATG